MTPYMQSGFATANGVETGSFNNLGYQGTETQGLWTFDNTGNGPNTIPRSQSSFGMLGMQNTDIIVNTITGAPEALLERNAFYMGLKKMVLDRANEIDKLKDTIGIRDQTIESQDKEIVVLTVRCKTLEGAVDRFAQDYHSLKDANGDSEHNPRTILTVAEPMPTPWKRDGHPDVTIWIKNEHQRALAALLKGESSGEAGAPVTKAKAGRPSKKDLEAGVVTRANIYLQDHNGVVVDGATLHSLSILARSTWESLLRLKMAPSTFSKMSYEAWDFFARVVLNNPKFDFLLLCDDGQWKLREWCTQNYSNWAGNHGLRPKNPGPAKNAKAMSDILKDSRLLQISPKDEEDNGNGNVEPDDPSSDNGDDEEGDIDDEDDDEGVTSELDNPSPNHATGPASTSSTQPRTNALAPAIPIFVNPFPLMTPSNSVVTRPTGPSATGHQNPPHAFTTTTANTPVVSPTPETEANLTGVTGEVTRDEAGPSCPTGTTPKTTLAPTTSGSLGRITVPPRPRSKAPKKLQTKSTVAEGSRDANPITPAVAVAPSVPTPVQTAGQSDVPGTDQTKSNSANATIPNARLVPGNLEKKRKGGDKLASAAKKQKVTSALAQPTNANTARNACMRDWNGRQEGGQGLAVEFDAYFKTLSDADKEPFKIESRVAQSAARKLKAAAKKTMNAPTDN